MTRMRGWGWLLGGLLTAGVGMAVAEEKLGSDGFPADWKPRPLWKNLLCSHP